MPIVRAVAPNQQAVEALPSRATRYEISVMQHRGLIVSVRPSGEKTFAYRRRQDGRLRRVALQATDLGGAVREWAAMRRDTRLGIDVAGRRREQEAAVPPKPNTDDHDPTIAQLMDRFVEAHAEPEKRAWRSDYNDLVKFIVPAWGDVKAKDLRRGDVHALLHGIARKRPLKANRILAAIRKLFVFGVKTGMFEGHACLACPVTHCVISTRAAYASAAGSAECASDCQLDAASTCRSGLT
jgi:hypothetical protein